MIWLLAPGPSPGLPINESDEHAMSKSNIFFIEFLLEMSNKTSASIPDRKIFPPKNGAGRELFNAGHEILFHFLQLRWGLMLRLNQLLRLRVIIGRPYFSTSFI